MVLLMMDGSNLHETSSFKRLGLSFPSNFDWGSSTVSIAKTVSKKIVNFICSKTVLSSTLHFTSMNLR